MNLSIASRVSLLMLAILTVAFVILTMFFNASNKLTFIKNEEKILSLHVERQIAYLEREFKQNKRDISLFLASKYLSRFIDSVANKNSKMTQGSNKDLTELGNEFKLLIENRKEYQQIRLIGIESNGREIIRVNRKGGSIALVLPEDLQEKGASSYFLETTKLHPGEYFISDVELNREHGVVELPETPVIRISAPVYTSLGKLFGVIVINVDFSEPLNHLTDYLDEGEEFILVNSDQSYINQGPKNIVLPNKSNTSIIENNQNQHTALDENSSDSIISQNRLNLNNGRYFTFILSKPVNQITENNGVLVEDTEIVFVILLLVISWILVFIARSPLKQIINVSQVIKGITEGTHQRIELPIGQRSEVGDLSRAFNKLLDKIDDTQIDLKLRKEQLELAIKGASDGLWDWNVITNGQYFSPRWKKMLGYNDDEIKNDYNEFNRLIHPDDLDKTWEQANQYLEGKIPKFEIEFRMHHKDGHYVDILSRAHAVRDENGKPVRLVGTHIDVTRRNQETKNRLKYEQEQKTTLVREVHHRIKNNLQGVASLLRQHAEFNPSVKDQLEAATSQVYTMGLVHGIQGIGEDRGVMLKEMVKEISSAASDLTNKNIIFKSYDEFCHCVLSEKEAVPLALIINELIINACKHGPIDSSISVKEEHSHDNQSLTLIIENISSPLPDGFSIKEKKGLGVGLGLVVSLMPPDGASLDVYEENGSCFARLKMEKPVVYKLGEETYSEV